MMNLFMQISLNQSYGGPISLFVGWIDRTPSPVASHASIEPRDEIQESQAGRALSGLYGFEMSHALRDRRPQSRTRLEDARYATAINDV